jgi:hypothetical protein
MTVQDNEQPDDAGHGDFLYLQSRGRTLIRVAGNHARWEHTMRAFGQELFFAENWTDGDGVEHRVVITPSFLDAHRKLQRSLVIDMEAWGTVGRTMADQILEEQRASFRQTTPFADGVTPPNCTPAPEDAC